jgi:uncharacterized protein YjdB
MAGCGGGSSGSSPSATPTLSSISLAPQNTILAAGLTRQFVATGVYSDGSKHDISSSVSWSAGTSAIASISSSGALTAVGAGSTTITATFDGVSGTTTLTVSPATLATISVTPGAPGIAKETQQQFAATGIYTDGSKHDLTSLVTWSSASTSVATISNVTGTLGLASAVAAGSTLITAALSGVSGSTSLTVTSATLVFLVITPGNPSITKGLNTQFTATGTFSDQSTQNLTSLVTWTSSNAAIAAFTAANGSAATRSQGSVTITATFAGVSGTASMTVTAATLMTIGVTTSSPKVPAGVPVQFTATGVYSDDSTQNLTAMVTWSSSVATVATISNGATYDGLSTTLSPGSTKITAALGIVSASTNLTVSSATLVSIGVTPASARIANGTSVQFTATGLYSDHSTQNLTDAATWTSGIPSVAAISNAAPSNGLASAIGVGTSAINARFGGLTSPSVPLTVSAATLVSIAVTPAPSLSIARGTTQQFKARGTYSDNTTQDLTTAVTWTSGSPGIASISNAAPSNGLAQTASVGTTAVTATVGGIASPAVLLTVTGATLVSIALTPGIPISIAQYTSQQFTATGTYSDHTTQNLTNSVVWSSTASDFAPGANGLFIGSVAGTASITATDPATQVTSDAVPITVTEDGLFLIQENSIDQPIFGPSFAEGTTLQFTATGFYNISPNLDITQLVIWSSSDPTIASISNTPPSNGLATGLSTGTTVITATLGNITSVPINTTVTPATLVSIAVTPTNASVANGSSEQFTAIGTYQDGTTFDITNLVDWYSSNSAAAFFNYSTTAAGLATTAGEGQSMVSAYDPATGIVSQPVTLTVTHPALATIAIYVNAIPPSGNLSFSKGATVQYYATGTYVDGSTQDITTSVTWLSSSPAIASISNTSPSNGLVTGLSVGNVSITATSGSITSFASAVAVTPAALTSIVITPVNPTIPNQSYEKFTATGTYRDGTTYDITNFVTWASSNTAVAYVNSAGAFIGQAFGETVGQTSITATDPQTGIISPATTLTVRP